MMQFGIEAVVPITKKTDGKVTLQSLEPLVVLNEDIDDLPLLVQSSKDILNNQKARKKDKWKVLVSSALCYSRAIETFDILHVEDGDSKEGIIISILKKRLGDAANEIG